MADVFISYSRKDKQFVQKLHQALTKAQRDTWVDWEDIPVTANWLAEIQAGIESAHNFVFVISPDSTESKVCQEEIDHAVACNKRLVPILFREPGGNQIHSAISSHNWLFFRDSDDFDQAFSKLIAALDTDLDSVKLHTRLLVRAREWQAKAQNSSFLLRGADLEEAEQWLTQNLKSATAEQVTYINASRRASTARQRLVFGSLLSGLLLALFLALIAFSQYQVARINEQTAVANGETATNAQGLAEVNYKRSENLRYQALAESMINRPDADKTAAVLLAIRSAKQLPDNDTFETLRKTLESPYPRKIISGHRGLVYSVALSPDNRFLLTASADRTVRLWDVPTGQELRRFEHPNEVFHAAFAPDGQTVLTVGLDNKIRLWNIGTGRKVWEFSGSSAAFSPDGRIILTGKLELRDPSNAKVIRKFDGPESAIQGFSDDGAYALSLDNDGQVLIWEVASGQRVRAFGQQVNNAQFIPGSYQVLTADKGFQVHWYDTAGNKELSSIAFRMMQARGGIQAYFAGTRHILLILQDAGSPALFAPSGELIRDFRINLRGISAALSPDERFVVAGYEDGSVRLWEVNVLGELSQFHVASPEPFEFDLSPDGRSFLPLGIPGASIWDIQSGKPGAKLPPELKAVHRSLDGKLVLAISGKGLHMLNADTLAETGEIAYGTPLVTAAFSPDGKYILVSDESGAGVLFDRASGTKIRDFSLRSVDRLIFAPDSKSFIVGGDGTLVQFDVASGAKIRQFDGETAAFSPDARRVVIGNWNTGRVAVWDAQNGRPIRVLMDFPDGLNAVGIYRLAFSPDSRFIMAVDQRFAAHLWDAASYHEIRRYDVRQVGLFSVGFSADSRFAVAADNDGLVHIWALDREALIAQACTSVARDLTPDERDQFQLTDAEPTCTEQLEQAKIVPELTWTAMPSVMTPLPPPPSMIAPPDNRPGTEPANATMAPVTLTMPVYAAPTLAPSREPRSTLSP